MITIEGEGLTLSLPRVINIKFPLQPHQKYYITWHKELGLSYLPQMKDDYNTNTHYLTLNISSEKVERMYFLKLGVKGLIWREYQSTVKSPRSSGT